MSDLDPRQNFDPAEELREERRFRTELEVKVTSAVEDQTGWVVDVSKRGLKLVGLNLPVRARVCVHFERQFAQGSVRWTRAGQVIGIALDEPLETGPLAAIHKRFQENVAAFGKHPRLPRPVFGRRSG